MLAALSGPEFTTQYFIYYVRNTCVGKAVQYTVHSIHSLIKERVASEWGYFRFKPRLWVVRVIA